jgi:hypothetical protein
MIQREQILSRFKKVYASTNDNSQYQCLCPSHDDKTASLGIKFDGDKLMLHCFAGCETGDVIKAAGLIWSDIMPNSVDNNYKPNRRFNPFAVLKSFRNDALFVWLCASNVRKKIPLVDSDNEKLLRVEKSLGEICDYIK